MKRITLSLDDLKNAVKLVDTVVNDKWNRDVPIIPGKPSGNTSSAK